MRSLAAGYHMKNQYAEAANLLQKALELDPNAATWTNLGTSRFFQGHFRDAVKAMERATELEPNNYLYWGNLGDAYRWAPGEQDKSHPAYARAIQLARAGLNIKLEDATLRSRLAVYSAKNGDIPGALDDLSRLDLSSTKDPGVLFRAAIVFELANRRDRALSTLKRSISVGYSMHEIENEPEFATLRSDDRYRKMRPLAPGVVEQHP